MKPRRISVLFVLALLRLAGTAALHFAAVAGLVGAADALQWPLAGGAILLASAGILVQHRRDTSLRELPHWLRATLLFFFLYVALDLALCAMHSGPAWDTRGGTGVWMTFYAVAAAMLWIPRRRGVPDVPAAVVVDS